MASQKPRGDAAPGLQLRLGDLPARVAWQAAVERLHRLTLLGLGGDIARVRVDLSSIAGASVATDVECRLTVHLRRTGRVVQVVTRHTDGELALMQAFTRAQREAQRRLDTTRRAARRRYLADASR
jgi:hypothetical protein